MINAPESLDTDLATLLDQIERGEMQLPEFQRLWTWDDNHIVGILASLSQGYPMGAIMRLEYGNSDILFEYHPIFGENRDGVIPRYLILDGQQRLTAIFRSMYSKAVVNTVNDEKKPIERFYYLSIDKCLDPEADRIEAVISLPKDKMLRVNFNRDIILDVSTREKEYSQNMFPLNIIYGGNAREDWADGYKEYYGYSKEIKDKYNQFRGSVLDTIIGYKLPVITLNRSTPRDAVCKVFENVNTGGVPLTVFDLVTAMFATKRFNLREDWNKAKDVIQGKKELINTDIFDGIDDTAYLTAITLYCSYKNHKTGGKATSCKRKDVLALRYEDYIANRDDVLNGFKLARRFILSQYVFKNRELPYGTQVIPLTAICAYIGKSKYNEPRSQSILAQWYWCGIFGEMYGGANETRYANDVEDVIAEIYGEENPRRTINAAYFSATRLLTLRTRLSAAYKGIMALVFREKCRDFMNNTTMDIVKTIEETPDIHHIFPENYCRRAHLDEKKWNSVVNKTPLLSSSNRAIGGDAPSVYSETIMAKANIKEEELRDRFASHLINPDYLMHDRFDDYFIDRAKKLLQAIENAMGKAVSDKNSEETIYQFGTSLE